MKNSNDTSCDRTSDLPICSTAYSGQLNSWIFRAPSGFHILATDISLASLSGTKGGNHWRVSIQFKPTPAKRPAHFQTYVVGKPVEARFSAPDQISRGVQRAPGHFGGGGKAAGAWRWPHTPSSAEVKERAELYFYSTSGPSLPVFEWILLFYPYVAGKAIRHCTVQKYQVPMGTQ